MSLSERQQSQQQAREIEAENLRIKLRDGVVYKKAGHRIKDFEDAGFAPNEAGMMTASSRKLEKQEVKLQVLEKIIRRTHKRS